MQPPVSMSTARWFCQGISIEDAIEQSALTPRQRELVLLDMIGLRRWQIAKVMGVTPATLTTYWKTIYERDDLHGADARAALHERLFPGLQISGLFL
jgi:DNA-binding CsgD family transcriptional regulator